MVETIKSFPVGIRDIGTVEDGNPAVQLFGRRFFSDQQVIELLAEFFLVMTSEKRIGEDRFDDYLPSMERLHSWPSERGISSLNYFPKAKLNLKLFAFLGSSRLETRHETHRKHCEELWNGLRDKLNSEDAEQQEDVLRVLSNLFLGFWGNGASRTWCAQSFLPFCKGVLAGETIWKQTTVRANNDISNWNAVLGRFNTFFEMNKHRFLSRGGEMLYLQLCNALRQPQDVIVEWLNTGGRAEGLTAEESDPAQLHKGLREAFNGFFNRTPGTLNDLADFIDTGIESETAESSDTTGNAPRKSECGWCAEDSWREGYLFAVELLRLLRTNVDIMETVELLQIACAMQLMRSLAAQSYRYSPNFEEGTDELNYRLLFSEPEGNNRRLKEFSRDSLTYVCREIYDAIRIDEIQNTVEDSDREKVYKQADNSYGHKLYRKIGKNIGLIVPRRGGGARFVLTDKILRYFVLSLIPTQRMTLDSFKQQIKLHHGFVFEEEGLAASPSWKSRNGQLESNAHAPLHLEQMLEASGVLVQLSDSCSLVKNPFKSEA